jgi:eukaryotic-like serine/threonine-protein kinase
LSPPAEGAPGHEAWARAGALLDELLDLPVSARGPRLAEACAGDDALKAYVERLLAADARAGLFLDTDAAGELFGLVEDSRRPEPAAKDDEEDTAAGARIGPWRVVHELGFGGMGAVFLAERADGQFEQRVALKLVKPGMDTDEILVRFRAERQILARLEHPHIARLLDGGASEAGQPYFAMEHVEGLPLTLYCDRARLSIEGRLRLFVQVCAAVEYAHRNLVVHRDLKPSNILVTNEGVAKLLDFGIAKVLDPSGDEDGLTMTRHGPPMTPQYAAPEQLLGQPVTTATDVYSLGLILFELLCGRPPHRFERLGSEEIERVLLQRERELPSSTVNRHDGGAAAPAKIAAARGLSTARLVRRLRGDLDRIVGMALRREPERRYASARALADDIERSLAGHPVAARTDGLGYRASKFVRRHRVGVAAASLVAVSVVAGLVGTVWQARQAMREARKAEAVKNYVFTLFGEADPNVGKGKEITARQLVEEGARRITKELSDQPEIEAEMLVFAGTVHYRLGLLREARPLFERALALRRELFGEDSLGVAEGELWVGTMALLNGELDEARRLLDRALHKRSRRLGEHHADTAYARGLLGRVHFAKGNLAEAEALVRQAVADERQHLPSPHVELASNVNFLGRILQAKADYDGAEQAFREGLEMRQQLFGDEHTRVSESQSNLAQVMRDKGDPRGAEAWFRKGLELDRRILGDHHEKVAIGLQNLGYGLLVTADYAEAERCLREALEIRLRLHGPQHRMTAQAEHTLARALRYQGELEEAEVSSRRALGVAAATLGDDHSNVASVRMELAEILRSRGTLGEAESLARQALSVQRAKLAAGHPTIADAQLTLARVLLAAGKAAEAEALLAEAAGTRRTRFGERDWRTAESRLTLAECLQILGREAEAEAHLAAARDVLAERLGPQHPLARRAESLGQGPARAAR